MAGGHLGQFIKENCRKGKEITERMAKNLIKQVIEATLYLHKERIIHRDIKPENILLDDIDDPKIVKISDFGLSVKHDKVTYEGLQAQCGTEIYRAPEQLTKAMYSKVGKAENSQSIFGASGLCCICFCTKELILFSNPNSRMRHQQTLLLSSKRNS